MPAATSSHPDRLAATMANLAASHGARSPAGCAAPASGAADCRIDLKLAQWRARRAGGRAAAARDHLAAYDERAHPDLWAGTVQDGVARGFAVLLEEAISLAPPDPFAGLAPLPAGGDGTTVFTGKDLRRKKDILIASGGPRVRFSRRGGLLLVDRGRDLHSENCLWFEGRRDLGTLDGFVAAADERARLFSAQFLAPERYVQTPDASELTLSGRLGRGPVGWPCRITLQGHADAPRLHLQIELGAVARGWRLRTRVLGVPPDLLHHGCAPVREVVEHERGFVADTLVRSCATLLVDGHAIAVPAAADPGQLCHDFWLGAPPE